VEDPALLEATIAVSSRRYRIAVIEAI